MSNYLSVFNCERYKSLRSQVEIIYGRQWALLDKAHQGNHFDDVFKTALFIKENAKLNISTDEMFLVSYFHDLFTWSRNNHQLLAKQFILTTNCRIVDQLTEGDHKSRDRVANACGEHRAYYTGKYSSMLSKVMAAADRGIPNDLKGMVERSRQYQLEHHTKDPDTAMLMAVCHIKKKFGRNGYARIPEMHLKFFEKEYEILWNEIDDLYEGMEPFIQENSNAHS